MEHKATAVVSAEAILRSKSGRSLAQTSEAITADNVEQFMPARETVAKAKRRLEALGFQVTEGGVSLSLTGTATQFEQVFGITFSPVGHPGSSGQTFRPDAEPDVPASLQGLVDKIVFPEPPEFFP